MDAPARFPVKTMIQTTAGPMPDTPEYERIRSGKILAEHETTTGTARLISYLSPHTGLIRYAVNHDTYDGQWYVTSYARLDVARPDYDSAVTALNESAAIPK
jgi:hypothetical protein